MFFTQACRVENMIVEIGMLQIQQHIRYWNTIFGYAFLEKLVTGEKQI